MSDPFMSAKSVFRRANYHITDLESILKVLPPDQLADVISKQEEETGDYVTKIVFRENFSDDTSCIMFDAINNLRACLDQMTFAIASKHRGGDKFVYFPFSKDAAHWPDKIKGIKNDLPPNVIAVFERFKPYKGGNNTLWALNYLANIKKHALLVPVGFLGTRIKVGGIESRGLPPPFVVTLRGSAKKDEIVIFRSTEPFNRHPNIEVAYNVVIDHAEEVIQGQPPIALLNAMRGEVERILMGTESECRRIGLIT